MYSAEKDFISPAYNADMT